MSRFCLLWVLFFPLTLGAVFWESDQKQEFAVTIVISTDTIPVTEGFTIQVTTSAPASYRLDEKKLRRQMLEGFNTVTAMVTMVDQSSSPEKVLYKFVVRGPGEYYVNLLTIPFISDTEPPVTLMGKIFPIQVTIPEGIEVNLLDWAQGVLPLRNEAVLDISQENQKKLQNGSEYLEQLAFENQQIFKGKEIPYFRILLAATGFFLLLWLRKPIMRKLRDWVKVVRDPRYLALKELKRVHPETDECFGRITGILRLYLEKAHSIPATHQTVPEIMGAVEGRKNFPTEMKARLGNLLKRAELIKFADAESTEEQRKEAIRDTRDFIQMDIETSQ